MTKKQKRNSLQKTFRDSIKYLKKEEWQALKESIDNVRDKIIINLLYSSGVRVGELCLMKIEEVDFSNGFIRIPKENTNMDSWHKKIQQPLPSLPTSYHLLPTSQIQPIPRN